MEENICTCQQREPVIYITAPHFTDETLATTRKREVEPLFWLFIAKTTHEIGVAKSVLAGGGNLQQGAISLAWPKVLLI
jgi:hypothetical protein